METDSFVFEEQDFQFEKDQIFGSYLLSVQK